MHGFTLFMRRFEINKYAKHREIDKDIYIYIYIYIYILRERERERERESERTTKSMIYLASIVIHIS